MSFTKIPIQFGNFLKNLQHFPKTVNIFQLDYPKKVKVKIYNAAGYLVEGDLINDKLTHYEFNEIPWNNIQVEAGLYLAEIKPDAGSSELVRLVVIK